MEEGQPRKKAKTIKWDEETIREHDKERGTRMKIDEPKTPFEYAHSSSEEPEQVDPQDIEEALEKHKKHQDFCTKRRQHYNEFQQMKALQQKLSAQQQQDELEEQLQEEQKQEEEKQASEHEESKQTEALPEEEHSDKQQGATNSEEGRPKHTPNKEHTEETQTNEKKEPST